MDDKERKKLLLIEGLPTVISNIANCKDYTLDEMIKEIESFIRLYRQEISDMPQIIFRFFDATTPTTVPTTVPTTETTSSDVASKGFEVIDKVIK